MKKLLLWPVLLTLVACSSKDAPAPPAAAGRPGANEAPLKNLYAESAGGKLRIYDDQGRILSDSDALAEGAEVMNTRGFVVVKFPSGSTTHLNVYNYRGQRLLSDRKWSSFDMSNRIFALVSDGSLLAVDTEGRQLPTGSQRLDERSEIWVSDNIVAYTADLRERDQLLEKRADGGETYSTKSIGRRLFAYTRQGLGLGTAGQIFEDGAQVFISNHLIGLIATLTSQGKLIKEEGNVKTYESIPVGKRLFTYADDGRDLPTTGDEVDEKTKIVFEDNFVRLTTPTADKTILYDGTVR